MQPSEEDCGCVLAPAEPISATRRAASPVGQQSQIMVWMYAAAGVLVAGWLLAWPVLLAGPRGSLRRAERGLGRQGRPAVLTTSGVSVPLAAAGQSV